MAVDPHDQDMVYALAEQAEAEFMYRYSSGTPGAVQDTLGMAATRLGGGVVLSMRHDPVNYWSKALGFGVDEPVDAELIGQVCDFYRAERTPAAVIQIAPDRLPADWDEIRARETITAGSTWVKLAAEADAIQPGRTELRVGPVTAEFADQWASVVLRGFGMPEEGLGAMLAASVTDPRFRPYAAWDGAEMVAGANLFVHGEVGALNAASTLPAHRGRGAQSALLAARAAAAVAAGCRWVTAETGRPEPGSSNTSLNNMLRAGLTPLYDRRNWLWRAAQ
ncbi:GNAT family N-acetyltransferase [Micromonospora sp. CPCC 205539]|uniref:GNAT family N-acetyltransferase n=1 Tax=Micromonospora sp. CPCC 205539 TaxID=3122408 RepID=UPI002FEFB28E